MSTSAPQVTFGVLTQEGIEALLSRHHVGRMAFAFQDRVDIEPIHYVFAEGALFGRTTFGTKLTVLMHHPWVAFEVDEVSGPFDWQSVVVKGTVYFLEPGGAAQLREAYEHALSVIQTVMPQAFTPEDPVPHRSILFRIHIHEMEGRVAETGAVGETRTSVRDQR
jgi:nitroimidazol reductase NimA-like FMN-containing flavoprotein (pyridoxamine 5'-phosphate oxidase superfamily)